VRYKDAEKTRGNVWVTRGASTRPALITHTEHGYVWVSYVDDLQPGSAKVHPRQLERR
jgi:hypothetical protein